MITVVTPTIPRRERLLAEAVESVEAQTLQPASHLIQEDHDFAGPAPTLNSLIERVETDWYAVLNDDDLLDPDHLEALWCASGAADVVMSWPHADESDVPPPYRGTFDPWKFVAKEDQGMRPGCYLARKTVWERVGGYRDMPIEDWDFMARAIFRRLSVAPVYRETWTYRRHDGQSSRVYEAHLAGRPVPGNTLHLAKWL